MLEKSIGAMMGRKGDGDGARKGGGEEERGEIRRCAERKERG